MALNRRALSELCFVVVMLAAAVAGEGSVLGAAGRHPLAKPSSCHAFGPQAIMEVLREKVDDVNKDQLDKYVNILKYLRAVPEILDRYLLGQGIATEHGAVLAEFETTLQQRLQVVRLDVLLPWVRLLKLQELAEQSGRLQQAAATALAINLRLALNSTKTTKQNILDSVHGLVDQYRGLFLNYKIIMDMWVENAWPDDSPEEKEEIIRHIYMHEFPSMMAKPLLYLLEDENQTFYHAYPSGYETIFDTLDNLSSIDEVESAADNGIQWNLLFERLPKGGSSTERGPLTQAQIEMEEEVLSTHIVDMMTGYPKKKGKQAQPEAHHS